MSTSKMKKRRFLLALSLLFLLYLAWFRWTRNETTAGEPPATEPVGVAPSKIPPKAPRDFTAELNALYLTPITFYGKVVDQHSKPIADATVLTISTDTLLGHGTDRMRRTDANGLFTLSGAHGSSLVIEVSKEGFHQLTNLQSRQHNMPPSKKGFAYALDQGEGIHNPDKANPQVFMLYRPGVLEPLLTRSDVEW